MRPTSKCLSYLAIGMATLTSFGSGPALGQDDVVRLLEEQVAVHGRCPASALELPRRDWTRFVGTTSKLYQNASPTSRPVDVQPKVFDDKVFIVAEIENRERILVRWESGTPSPKSEWHCAFANRSDLLPLRRSSGEPRFLKPRPLKFHQLKDIGAGKPATRTSSESQLDLKVVIQNLHVEGAEAPALLESPSGTVMRYPKLYDVYHVYRYMVDARSELWYLAGEADYEPKILGWISEKDVYVLTSRMAVFWAGTGAALGYTGYKNDEFIGAPIKEPEFIVSESSVSSEESGNQTTSDAKPPPYNRIIPRFPLLRQEPEPRVTIGELPFLRQKPEPRVTIEELKTKASQMAYLKAIERLVVVVPGSTRRRSKEPGGAPRKEPPQSEVVIGDSNEALHAARQRIVDRMRKLTEIDVLFVIDATKSMLQYFPIVVDAVQDFIAGAGDDLDQKIQFGVTTYGDYDSSGQQVTTRNEVPLHIAHGAGGLMNELDRLGKNDLINDDHADHLEAPLAAIVEIVKKSEWNDNAGIRTVVHIGDHGSRKKGMKIGQSDQLEQHNATDLAQFLLGETMFYVPIAVRGRYSPDENSAMVRQMKGVSSAMGLFGTNPFVSYTGSKEQEDQVKLKERITNALRGSLRTSQTALADLQRDIECAKYGAESAKCDSVVGKSPSRDPEGGNDTEATYWARISEELRERNGLGSEIIKNVFSRDQSVLALHFRPLTDDGRSVFTYWVAFDHAAYGELVEAATRLCRRFNSNNVRALSAMFSRLIPGASGDHFENLGELLSTALDIPLFALSPILSRPWKQLESTIDSLEQGEEFLVFHKHFCRSAIRLELIEKRQRLKKGKEPVWEGEEFFVPSGSIEKFDWSTKTEGGSKTFFVPLEFLP